MSNANVKNSIENFNRDVLVKMSDSEVNDMLSQFKNRIEVLSRRGESTKLLETEFCYIQDEAQRRARYSPVFSYFLNQNNPVEA